MGRVRSFLSVGLAVTALVTAGLAAGPDAPTIEASTASVPLRLGLVASTDRVDAGDIAVGQAYRSSLLLTNTGPDDLSVTGAFELFAGAGWTVSPTRGCSVGGVSARFWLDVIRLDPGASCALGVEFVPRRTGRTTDRYVLEIAGGGPGVLTSTIEFTANVAGPGLVIDAPQRLRFTSVGGGAVPVGSTTLAIGASVSNPTAQAVTGLSLAVPPPFRIVDRTCTSVVPPGGICGFGVVYAPTERGESFGDLTISWDGLPTPESRPLYGRAVRSAPPAPTATVSVSRIDFPPLRPGQSADARFTITAGATGTLVVSPATMRSSEELLGLTNISVVDGGPGSCPLDDEISLAPGRSCDVAVRFDAPFVFAPPGVVPSPFFKDEVVIDTNGGTLVVPARAEFARAIPAYSPSLVAFPGAAVGSTTTSTVRIDNLGSAAMTLRNPRLSGDHAGDFAVVSACATDELAPGESCTLTVAATPTATGRRTASLSVGWGPIDLVADVGPFVVDRTGLSFGRVLVGDTVRLPVRVASQSQGTIRVDAAVTGSGMRVESFCGQPGASQLLGGGVECDVVVAATPTSAGLLLGSLQLSTPGSPPVFISLSGSAIDIAFDPEVLDVGAVPVAGDRLIERVVSVRNVGTATRTVAPVTSSNPAVIPRSTCGTVLAGRSSCVLILEIDPPVAGPFEAIIGGGELGTMTVRGVAVAPRPVIDPPALAFTTGVAATLSTTLRNEGLGTFTVGVPWVSGPDAGDFLVGGCLNTRLTSSARCDVTVAYRPGTRPNPTAQLNVPVVGGATLVVPLSASGAAQDIRAVSQSAATTLTSLDLGNARVNRAGSTGFARVLNTGTAPMRIGSIVTSGPFDVRVPGPTNVVGVGSVPGCTVGLTLAAGGQCFVGVQPRPFTGGTMTGRLTVRSDAPGPTEVALRARSLALETNRSSLDFGAVAVGASATRTLDIGNLGDSAWFLAPLTAPAPFSLSGCVGTWLQPGQVCTITATFSPTSTAPEQATVTLVGSDGSSHPVNLRGGAFTLTGVLGVEQVEGKVVAVGEVLVPETPAWSTATVPVLLQNTSPSPVTVTGASIDDDTSDSYEVDASGCVGALPADGVCTLQVAYTPSSVTKPGESLTATLSVQSDADIAAVTLVGTGSTPVTPPAISLGDVTVSPGVPIVLSALRTDGRSDPLTWTWSTTAGKVAIRPAAPAPGGDGAVVLGIPSTPSAPVFGPTVEVDGIEPGSSVQITVEAVDAFGRSGTATATVTVTSPPAPPPPPQPPGPSQQQPVTFTPTLGTGPCLLLTGDRSVDFGTVQLGSPWRTAAQVTGVRACSPESAPQAVLASVSPARVAGTPTPVWTPMACTATPFTTCDPAVGEFVYAISGQVLTDTPAELTSAGPFTHSLRMPPPGSTGGGALVTWQVVFVGVQR